MIDHLIRGSGYLRGAGTSALHKEWFHFAIAGEEVEVLANFSVMNSVPRVTLIVRTADRWYGEVETIPREHVFLGRGAIELRFGQNSLRYTARGFEVSILLTDHQVSAELVLVPRTLPIARPSSPLESGPIHWMVVPCLSVSGYVIAGGRKYVLEDAPAYHDHNWGRFIWGEHAWQWGFAVPRTFDEDALTLTFVRLLDKNRARDIGRGLLVWKGSALHRVFHEEELTVVPSGYFRPAELVKFPRAAALISPERPTDVPAKIEISARGRGDNIDLCFESQGLMQILVPNDENLGVTAINEISGKYSASGSMSGAPVSLVGRGYFEVLTISEGPAARVAPAFRARSFGRPRGFVEFLRAALAVLASEAPEAHRVMCTELAGRVVGLTVDGESLSLAFTASEVREVSTLTADVSLATDGSTILDLCDGTLTLARAVTSDRLELRGKSPDLIRFDAGLFGFLGGAVRTASFPDLLHDYRTEVQRS